MSSLKLCGLPRAMPALLLVLGAVQPACAHALGAECKLRGDRVEVEAYYDDDTPARDARIWVQDADKRTVAEGYTDAKGTWSFPRPEAGRYWVTVDTGAGHRVTVTITVPTNRVETAAAAGVSSGECDCCWDGAASGGEEAAVKLSDGPGRSDFTRTPWLQAAIGLGAILGFSLTARWALRYCRAGIHHPAGKALGSQASAAGSSSSTQPWVNLG